MMHYLNRLKTFWIWVVKQFIRDNCVMRASGLTFTSLLAIVPLTVVVFSIIRILPFFDKVSNKIQSFIFDNFVPHSGEVVQHYIHGFEQQASNLPVIGFAFLIVTAILMMVNIEKTLNQIWGVRYNRHFTGSLLLYWAMLTLGPLLVGISLAASSYLTSLQWLHDFDFVGPQRLLLLLPTLSEFLAIFFLYVLVPHCTVRLRDAAVGALVATLLFECAKKLFTFYVVHFPTYELLYGAMATIPLFLLWLYLSWLIFLFGAEVVNGLRFHQAARSGRHMPYLFIAYRVLGHLYQAQRQGGSCSMVELLDSEPDCKVASMKKVLRALQNIGWVQGISRDRYVLNADLHQITLAQLIQTTKWHVPCEGKPHPDAWNEALVSALKDWQTLQAQSFAKPLAQFYGSARQ